MVSVRTRALAGNDLRRAILAATRLLERYREPVNALNVFPVPDGDTGTNMHLTMRDVCAALEGCRATGIGEVAAAAARGAVLGSRGNSGVILSQYLSGLGQGLQGVSKATGPALASALEQAGRAAYQAVGKPVEGTMLTVARLAGEAAQARAQAPKADPLAVFEATLEGAHEALRHTPELLPTLRDAGVVDAGGQGLVVLLEGIVATLRGQDVEQVQVELASPVLPGALPQVSEEFLRQVEQETYGYCTQFLLRGDTLDVAAIRQRLAEMAASTVVVGDASVVKVHVHAEDPGPIISYAVSQGVIGDVHLENIDAMHQEFAALHRQAATPRQEVALAVVAVAWGDGFEQVFSNFGARVVASGRTMNPSTQNLLQAAEATAARDVVLLPNNPNVIPAARQATALAQGRRLHVVPTRTLPQGIAAAVAFNPAMDVEANLKAMAEAMDGVTTIEVVRAVRAATVDGVRVRAGQAMAMVNERLAAVGPSPLAALQEAVRKAQARPGNLVTLYWGGDVQEEEARRAAEWVQETFTGVEAEVVAGGQPFYDFIASVE